MLVARQAPLFPYQVGDPVHRIRLNSAIRPTVGDQALKQGTERSPVFVRGHCLAGVDAMVN